MALLGDLVEITGGGTPSRKVLKYWNGDIPWATVKDFKSIYLNGALESITHEGLKSSASNYISAGSIIVPTRMAVGKAAINTVGMAINQDLKALKIKDSKKVDRDYLFRFLLSKSAHLERRGKGATVKGITLNVLKELEISLPPLEEQKHIAAILDKADALRRKRQQTIDLTDQLLRSVFLDMFGDPVTNPKGFEVKFLKDIARIQIGPFGTQLHKEDYIEGGIPLINPTHIVNGRVLPKSNLSISDSKHGSLCEYHLAEGDIIMGRRGEMGRCALITNKEDGWMCGTGSLFIRPHLTGLFSEYLCTLLSSDAIKSYLEGESLGATMPNLNKKIVGNLKIPVPDKKTMNKYSQVRKKYDTFTGRLNKFLAINLFDSLSQQAFRGELTKQTKAA